MAYCIYGVAKSWTRLSNRTDWLPAIILSPPLVFLVVMLPEGHLTSHSRMFGFRWFSILLCLSGTLRPFIYISVYFCHIFFYLFLLFYGTLQSVGYNFHFIPWLLLLFSGVCKAPSNNHCWSFNGPEPGGLESTIRNREKEADIPWFTRKPYGVLFLGLALLHGRTRSPLELVKAQCAFSRGS